MTDIWFNVRGGTHHLRVLPVDRKPGGVTVWEALTDGWEYTYFEGHDDIEVWDLIELAVESFLDYRVDDGVVRRGWL